MEDSGGGGRGKGRKKAESGGSRGKSRKSKKKDGCDNEERAIVVAEGEEVGPSVAVFDYCVQSHLRTLDLISMISAEKGEEIAWVDEIERFSSMVAFIKGWKQFCNYEPKTVRFAHDAATSTVSDACYGFELPQFSAASIPKVDREHSGKKTPKTCNDFVLQVGGPVWALDWCPRVIQPEHKFNIQCEYLAVAAHPPDSSFHKVGAALSGPGFVQIWFILNTSPDQGSLLSSDKGRVKKRSSRRKSVHEDIVHVLSTSRTVVEAATSAGDNDIRGSSNDFDSEMSAHVNESLSNWMLGSHGNKKKLKGQARAGTDNTACSGSLSQDQYSKSSSIPEGDSHFTVGSVLKELSMPKIVLCLGHEGRVAWDMKWKPCSKQENCCRVGFLAVLLGDSSIQVWEIPSLRIMKALFISCHAEDTDPRFVKLKPVFQCSNLQRGESKSIPLTLEWSRAVPNDLILVGCHDGTVALWKFLPKSSSEDTRPLLCFTADTFPIRALSWAPYESDPSCEHLVATAGHSGNLRFWDMRDPFRPLWEIHLSRGFILSLDWVLNPSSVIFSMDDGTVRILSLLKAASDVPVTGIPFTGKPWQGLQTYYCSPHAVWSLQVSQVTGMVAYCSSDGLVLHFQLTSRAVEKDKRRHRTPHYVCGSLVGEKNAVTFSIPLAGTASPMMKSLDESGNPPRPHRISLSDLTHGITALPTAQNYDQYPNVDAIENSIVATNDGKCRSRKDGRNVKEAGRNDDTMDGDDGQNLQIVARASAQPTKAVLSFPPKIVSMHKVRWNPNRGSENWLCYGGAAGIVRCQEVTIPVVER